jgi:hypothetical protein
MVIAALVSFGLLLAAWIAAPDRPRRTPDAGHAPAEVAAAEVAEPIAA